MFLRMRGLRDPEGFGALGKILQPSKFPLLASGVWALFAVQPSVTGAGVASLISWPPGVSICCWRLEMACVRKGMTLTFLRFFCVVHLHFLVS